MGLILDEVVTASSFFTAGNSLGIAPVLPVSLRAAFREEGKTMTIGEWLTASALVVCQPLQPNSPDVPSQKWGGDLTYIWTTGG
jgi:hypothetical protein